VESAVLRIQKLNFSYGDLQVLWDLDLEVKAGEIVTVVGANGAGKSTTLKNVSRLVRPSSGSLTFEDQDLLQLESHQVVERGVVQVPEGRRIFPEMTVVENLRMGSYVKATRKDREKNIERCFTLFPRLKERETQLGGTMSGGEQQMLAIARGLMANPRLMLLDEPSLGLSPLFVKNIFEIIQEINRQGTTILLVEQNVFQSLRISHRAYVLETGRVVLSGTGAELLGNEHVKKAFLGA
jgi:branched-chain amino acid transport system ATP-binding protein